MVETGNAAANEVGACAFGGTEIVRVEEGEGKAAGGVGTALGGGPALGGGASLGGRPQGATGGEDGGFGHGCSPPGEDGGPEPSHVAAWKAADAAASASGV